MNSIWILTIYYGITWAGPAGVGAYEFPNEKSCYQALKSMKTTGQPIAESDNHRDMIAFCRPKFINTENANR